MSIKHPVKKKRAKIQMGRKKGTGGKTNAVTKPTLYNGTIASKICGLVIEGFSLKKIGAMDRMPDTRTIHNWFHDHPEFREAYDDAKVLQMDTLGDRLLDIPEETKFNIPEGVLLSNNIKFLMTKLAHRKYGDKVTIGGDKNEPIQINVTYKRSDRYSQDENE